MASRSLDGATAATTRNAGDALPTSVRAAIVSRQDRSERLIGWLQLVKIAVFAVLYALSRKTTPMNTVITPVAIALYLRLTAFRTSGGSGFGANQHIGGPLFSVA